MSSTNRNQTSPTAAHGPLAGTALADMEGVLTDGTSLELVEMVGDALRDFGIELVVVVEDYDPGTGTYGNSTWFGRKDGTVYWLSDQLWSMLWGCGVSAHEVKAFLGEPAAANVGNVEPVEDAAYIYQEFDYCMVVNDGETYTNLAGCRIVAVPRGSEDLNRARTIRTFDGPFPPTPTP